MTEISLTVNGTCHKLMAEENWTLLHVLREVLHLTGTKYGCGTADCGACKVLVDGQAKNACVLLAKNMQGKSIITIEGVGQNPAFYPVQKAFVDAGAVQCGYCTPGMVITSIALLSKNPNPSKGQIVTALKENLCRCTGYKKFIKAVLQAAKDISRGAWHEKNSV